MRKKLSAYAFHLSIRKWQTNMLWASHFLAILFLHITPISVEPLQLTAGFSMEDFLEFSERIKTSDLTQEQKLFGHDGFFSFFTGVLLPPSWKQNSGALENILTSVEIINMKLQRVQMPTLNLMLASDPEGLRPLVNEIQLNSRLFNKTTSTILLDIINPTLSTPEIFELSSNITNVYEQFQKLKLVNVSLGVYFSLQNCHDNIKIFHELPMNFLSLVGFLPNASKARQQTDDEVLRDIESCIANSKNFLTSNVRLSISMVGTFGFDSSNFEYLEDSINGLLTAQTLWKNNPMNLVIPINLIKTGNTVESVSAENVSQSSDMEIWLHKNNSFDAKNFGYAFFCDREIIDLDTLISELVKLADTVVIQNYLELNKFEIESCFELVDVIYNKRKNDFKNRKKLRVLFRLNLNYNATVIHNREIILQLANLTIQKNAVYSNIVTSVIVNFMKFGYTDTSQIAVEIPAYEQIFAEVSSKQSFNSHTVLFPKLGMTINGNSCPYMSKAEISSLEKAALISFAIFVVAPNFGTIDPTSFANSLIEVFETCKNDITRSINEPEIYFYLSITSCNLEYKDANALYKYGLFMETIANWAVAKNNTVLFSKAFEYALNVFVSSSSVRSVMTAADFCGKGKNSNFLCYCGWWVINAKYVGFKKEYTFTDKKTLARVLYENETLTRSRSLTNRPKENVFASPTLYIEIAVCIIIVVLVAGFLLRWKYHTLQLISDWDYKEFKHGGESRKSNESESADPDECYEMYESLAYDNEKYEVARSEFKIDYTTPLGSGEFGQVYLATLKTGTSMAPVTVAVKTLQKISRGGIVDKQQKLALRGILSEIKILSYLGAHDHIIKLEKAYTKRIKSGRVFVFLEYCELGCLHKYLQNLQKELEDEVSSISSEVYSDLNQWAVEIADGMEYLALKKLVHADLATRNVLLDSSKTAKIADFGLSRRLYDYTSYVKQQNQEPLPWRWMAPESLRKLVFDEKTDVWAFGVTLWEIYTLGDTPYPGLNWQPDFPMQLEHGLRLSVPKYNDREMYSMMLRCWDVNPAKRPTFSKLKVLLHEKLSVDHDELQLSDCNDHCNPTDEISTDHEDLYLNCDRF